MKNGEYTLSTEKVSKAFWKLAIPALLTTLISQIYNLTDTYFIGLLRDTSMLSAVSLAMPVMWLISAIGGMIGAGAPQLISLKMGAGDLDGAKRCRAFCVFGTLVMSLAITPVALLIAGPALRLMNGDGAVYAHAMDYLTIILASTAFSTVGGAMQGILRADGRTRQASIASMAGIVTNIILDPLFILAFDMGMAGAAWATAMGYVVSLIVGVVYLRGDISVKHIMPKAADIGMIFKISLASTASSVITCLTVGMGFTIAGSFGGNTMASISVCSKVYSVAVSIVNALAFSIQPFIGYNYGKGDHDRLLKGLGTSLGIGTLVCLASSAVFALGGGLLMRAFTNDTDLIANGARMLRYMAIGLPVNAILMNCMSYLNGTGKAMRTLALAMAKQVLIFAPVMLIMQHFFGETGMMLAYPVGDVISTIPAVAMCVGEIKKIYSERAKTTGAAEAA